MNTEWINNDKGPRVLTAMQLNFKRREKVSGHLVTSYRHGNSEQDVCMPEAKINQQ